MAVSNVHTGDGDLVEFGLTAKEAKKVAMPDKQAFYSECLGLAAERGHSEGWASHLYRSKFQVWPNHLDKLPSTPSAKVRNYEHSRRIAYIKGKQKAEKAATGGTQ